MIYQTKKKVWAPWIGRMLINEYRCSICGNVMGKRPGNNKCTSCKK